MRRSILLLAVLWMTSPGFVLAAEDGVDSRYPVTLSPEEALQQKAAMRTSLVALRRILDALARRDFPAVEKNLPELGHQALDIAQRMEPKSVYRRLEGQFQASIGKIQLAARARDLDAVLRELSDTMSSCQTCHAALRQDVVPAAPAAPAAPPDAAPAKPQGAPPAK